MKKKIFTLLISGIMISINASSQTIQEKIDKIHKDKNTADRAAKADVIIHKKTVYDSTTLLPVGKKVVSKTPGVNKVKHKKKKHKVKFKKATKKSI